MELSLELKMSLNRCKKEITPTQFLLYIERIKRRRVEEVTNKNKLDYLIARVILEIKRSYVKQEHISSITLDECLLDLKPREAEEESATEDNWRSRMEISKAAWGAFLTSQKVK